MPGEDDSRCSPAASFNLGPRVVNRFEPVDVETFVPERAVEGLDEGIVGWLAGSAEVELHTVVMGPEIHHPPGEFATVVDEHARRGTTSANQRVANPNHIFAAQSGSHFDRQCFPAENVDDRQRPKLVTACELV